MRRHRRGCTAGGRAGDRRGAAQNSISAGTTRLAAPPRGAGHVTIGEPRLDLLDARFELRPVTTISLWADATHSRDWRADARTVSVGLRVGHALDGTGGAHLPEHFGPVNAIRRVRIGVELATLATLEVGVEAEPTASTPRSRTMRTTDPRRAGCSRRSSRRVAAGRARARRRTTGRTARTGRDRDRTRGAGGRRSARERGYGRRLRCAHALSPRRHRDA